MTNTFKTITNAGITLFVLSLFVGSSAMAAESLLWQQFKDSKLNDLEPQLPDFSYAGYDYSETDIPDISQWPVFNVTDYGAVANDGQYDDVAIQNTINAASENGGGVVFFPEGRFMVSPNETVGENIFVRSSNLVLKGSGTDKTEIFMDKMKVKNGRYIFEIGPADMAETTLTTVIEKAQRESYKIKVADSSALSVGQRIILRTDSVDFAVQYYHPQSISPFWTRLLDPERGFHLRELHTVAAINGNEIILREPLHLTLNMVEEDIQVRSYNVLTHVGIEDILFTSNWGNYPEKFVHHINDIHDYAWNAVRMDNVANSWVRNTEFRDWNQVMFLDGVQAVTLDNLLISGKRGHSSIHTRRSYGVLVKDSVDTAAHHHGPGVGYFGTGTVYLRYQMADEQRIDSHSGSPYATLLDNVSNGQIYGSGGPHESYPHHGKYFTFWNFLLKGGPSSYEFWPTSRNGNTFARPYFIGLHGESVSIDNASVGANESQGTAVSPSSLFEAQLQLRLEQNDYGIPFDDPVLPFEVEEVNDNADSNNNDDGQAEQTPTDNGTTTTKSAANYYLLGLLTLITLLRVARAKPFKGK